MIEALAMWALAATGPVQESNSALRVDASGCQGLQSVEVERLIELELAAVTQEIRAGPPLQVSLTCEAETMTIAVDDPVTTKHLQRKVPVPPDEPGQERVVALAVAQLFAASWLELLIVEDDEPANEEEVIGPRPAPGTSPTAVVAARRVVEDKARRRTSIELAAGGGVRGRAIEAEPFAAAHTDLELRAFFTPSVGIVGRVGFDIGQAVRTIGQVRGLAVVGAAGLAWRVRPRPAIGVGGSALLGAGWARINGRPSLDGGTAGTNQGATGEFAAGIGPRVFAGRFRMDIDAEIGGMLRAPEGTVAREPSVSMGGLWVGATLRLGLEVTSP